MADSGDLRNLNTSLDENDSKENYRVTCSSDDITCSRKNTGETKLTLSYDDIKSVKTKRINDTSGFKELSIIFVFAGLFLTYVSLFHQATLQNLSTPILRLIQYGAILSFPAAVYIFLLDDPPSKELRINTGDTVHQFFTRNEFSRADEIADYIERRSNQEDKVQNNSDNLSNDSTSNIEQEIKAQADVVDTIESLLEEGDELFKDGKESQHKTDFETALQLYKDARGCFQDAVSKATRTDSFDTESLENRIEEVNSLITETQYEQLRSEIELLRSELDRVTETIAEREFTKADQALETIEESLDNLSNTAVQHQFSGLQDDIDELKHRHTHLTEELSKQKNSAKFEQEIETLKPQILGEKIDQSIDNIESERTRLIKLGGELNSIRERTNEYQLSDLESELSQLEGHHAELLSQLRDQAVPTEIPVCPEIKLSYHDLENKETIGKGGNADVLLCTINKSKVEYQIAIKNPRVAGTLQVETIERILAEAETWDKLDGHEYIVDVIDWGSEPIPWIAMEYMNGGDLRSRIGEMGFSQSIWTAVAVTRAVRHAHRNGIAHLDLKPENILFRTIEDSWDVPKVGDWGLSKQLLEQSKSIEGLSPQYAAPEQFSDQDGSTDDLTDIYQLGAVFYELFTGEPLFEGPPVKVMNQVLNKSPQPPSEIAAVPRELDDVLLTALAKEKTERYDDIVYFRDALQQIEDDWWST